ncbi:MAG: hypothetical protein ACLFUS_16090, partial [Candidatus Sumerlaeia bacterium]
SRNTFENGSIKQEPSPQAGMIRAFSSYKEKPMKKRNNTSSVLLAHLCYSPGTYRHHPGGSGAPMTLMDFAWNWYSRRKQAVPVENQPCRQDAGGTYRPECICPNAGLTVLGADVRLITSLLGPLALWTGSLD